MKPTLSRFQKGAATAAEKERGSDGNRGGNDSPVPTPLASHLPDDNGGADPLSSGTRGKRHTRRLGECSSLRSAESLPSERRRYTLKGAWQYTGYTATAYTQSSEAGSRNTQALCILGHKRVQFHPSS